MTVKEYIDYRNNSDIDKVIEYNKELVKEYPFLIIRNRFTDDIPEEYDYSFTELDELEDGWRIAFSEDLLKDLKNELIKSDYLDKYRIAQIKEKFGGLRWYDNGNTKDWLSKILPKYEKLSETTCGICGKPAKYIGKSWIYPYCEECAKKALDNINKYYDDSMSLEEYFTVL